MPGRVGTAVLGAAARQIAIEFTVRVRILLMDAKVVSECDVLLVGQAAGWANLEVVRECTRRSSEGLTPDYSQVTLVFVSEQS